jgi:hypothetical protein
MMWSIALECVCAAAILYFTLRGLAARCRSSSRLPAWASRAHSRPGLAIAGRQPRAARGFRQCRRLERVVLAGRLIGGPVAGGLLYGLGPETAYTTALALLIAAVRC